MIYMPLYLDELEVDSNEIKVPDRKKNYQSIFELEDNFDNSGHKQGVKYASEQRMKTIGY
jgi:hypothetical protein